MKVCLLPKRPAHLNDYARRHGEDPDVASDEALAARSEWQRQDANEVSAHGIGEELRVIGARCAALTDYDSRNPEEIIGFDKHGVPE